MAGKYARKNKVAKREIYNYNYILNGEAGIGKTTFFMETFTKLYGLDGNLLITVGKEPSPSSTDFFWTEKCPTFEDLLDLLDELYYNKSDYPELKMVAIDSLDELFNIAEDYIVRKYNDEVTDIDKKAKSVKAAYGGYQEGEKFVKNITSNSLFRLNDVGIGLFFIGHTKTKSVKDTMQDLEYSIISSNVSADYYRSIFTKVNVAMCAYKERDITNIQKVKDQYNKKEKLRGKLANEVRMLSFRDETHTLDVKAHFKNIESKCLFDSDVFVDTINQAIKDEYGWYDGFIDNNSNKSSVAPTKQERKRKSVEQSNDTEDVIIPIKDAEEPSDEIIFEPKFNREEALDYIRKNIGNADGDKALEVLTAAGVKKIDDASDDILAKLLSLI